MREAQADVRLPRDLQCLRHAGAPVRAVQIRRSRLAHVDGASLTHRLPELDQLRGIRPRARIVAGAGRESDGTLLYPLSDQPFGRLKRVAPEGQVVEPEDLEAHGAVRHEIGRVDGNLAVVVAPEGRDAAHVQVVGRVAQEAGQPVPVRAIVRRRERRVRHAIDAQELGGDALPQAVGMLWIDQERAFGVRMRIDETQATHSGQLRRLPAEPPTARGHRWPRRVSPITPTSAR